MEPHLGELEALGSVQEILDGYDRTTDRWNFSFDSAFWKAVHHAHSQGRRGQGRRIAVIDSGCDRNIPRLRQRVESIKRFVPGFEEEGTQRHGTAVALLISEVAPEAHLDVYRVIADDGGTDLDAIVDAIEAAAKSDAAVINLSLGEAKPAGAGGSPIPNPWKDPVHFKRDFCREEPPCRLCLAAAAGANAGKLVFAAVGNSIIEMYCPARMDGVIAVGFQREESMTSGSTQVTYGLPVLEEAPYAELFVRAVAGVLGSSFACPLYAGVGALGVAQSEMDQYVSSLQESVFPKFFHAEIDRILGGPQKARRHEPDLVDEVEKRYRLAIKKLPHAHCSLQTHLMPNLPLTDPAGCVFCGFFAEQLYVKAGLWLYETSRFKHARELLEAALGIAPWSAEACAYLGMTFHAQGDSAQAFRNYRTALRLRPGYPLVLECLNSM